MKWLYKITGGRPMIRISPAFIDAVSWEQVIYYRDRLHGDIWMATGKWGWFRVKVERR